MGSFIVAHVFYSNSFGWRPNMFKIAIFTYFLAFATTIVYFNMIADPLIRYAVPFYIIAIYTMGWRALVRISMCRKINFYSSEVLGLIGKRI